MRRPLDGDRLHLARLPLLTARRGGGSGEPAPHPVPPPEMPESTARLLLTVEEAADRLGIGRSHMYRYLERGELRSVRLGRCRRVVLSDLLEFIVALPAASGAA